MSVEITQRFNPQSISQTLLPGQTCAFDLGSINLQFRNAFLNGYLSLLGSEAGAAELRLQESVGDVQIVNSANLLQRSLLGTALPTVLTPTSVAAIGTSTKNALADHVHGASGFSTLALDGIPPTVNASGQVAGAAATASRSDHRHQLANPITGAVVIAPSSDVVSLTIRSGGGLSDILDITNAAGSLTLAKFSNSGNFTMFNAVTISPTTNQVLLTMTSPGAGTQTLDLVVINSTGGVLVFELLKAGNLKLTSEAGQIPLTVTASDALNNILLLASSTNVTLITVGPTGATNITPSANVVPLTLQEPSGGSVDILDILDSTATVQALFQSTGSPWFKKSVAIGANAPATAGGLRVNQIVSSGGSFSLITTQTLAYTLTGVSTFFNFVNAVGTVTVSGTSNNVTGLKFQPTVTMTANANTLTAILAGVASTGAFTLTESDAITAQLAGPPAGQTITTMKGLNLVAQSATVGTLTTLVGLDLGDLSLLAAATSIAIRQVGTGDTNRLAGKTRIGDIAFAPTRGLEVNSSIALRIISAFGAYTALLTDHYILGDASFAAFTITLPSSASAGANTTAQRISIKKIDSSANAVTIAAAGADTIQGAASVALSVQYAERTLYTDGSGTWFIESTI